MKIRKLMMLAAVVVLLTGCGRNAGTTPTDANDIPDSVQTVDITMDEFIEANSSERLLEQFGCYKVYTVYDPDTEYEVKEEILVSSNEQGLTAEHYISDYVTYYVQDGEIFFQGSDGVEEGEFFFLLSDYDQYVESTYGYISVLPIENERITSQQLVDDETLELVTELDVADMSQEQKENVGIEEGKMLTYYTVNPGTLAVQTMKLEVITSEAEYIGLNAYIEYGMETPAPSKWKEMKEMKMLTEQSMGTREITYIVNPGTVDEKTVSTVLPKGWYALTDIRPGYGYYNDAEGREPFTTGEPEDVTIYVIADEQ